ncbi:MAG: helix-turn-helix transcriptional regulator [Actinomycetota bacterium]
MGALTDGNRPGLTPRELDVLVCVTEGLTNAEIAATLHIAVGTVKQHLSTVYAKLGVSNRTQAAVAFQGSDEMFAAS